MRSRTSATDEACRHLMQCAGATYSCKAFLAEDDMLSHFSKATLFSDAARAAFVAPDLSPISQQA